MFKRKIEEKLERWLASLPIKRKALMLRGARQVGKTTVIDAFLKKHFEEIITINFKFEKEKKKLFAGDVDAETLLERLRAAYPSASFDPRKMAFFFDEIQDCNGARAALKPLMEKTDFVIACSGSLLGIAAYNDEGSKEVSVGFEYDLTMHSMDFEEFLWAKGERKEAIDAIRLSFAQKKSLDPYLHAHFSEAFREYLCLGGMPEVIDAYLKTKDLRLAHESKSSILANYRDDFAKHLDKNGREVIKSSLLAKINRVYDSLPGQLASERRRFVLSHLGSNASKESYYDAIEWLLGAGIVKRCQNLSAIQQPLIAYPREGYFKLYFQDVGLLLGALPFYVTSALYNGTDEIGIYKGPIYENFVADTLNKNDLDLFYYRKDTGLEIDFVSEIRGKVVLIEVKSTNGDAKAAKTVLEDANNPAKRCIKITSSNLGDDGVYLTIPHYMAFLLDEEAQV